MSLFKPKQVNKEFTLEETKLEEGLDTTFLSSKNRVLSTDRSVNSKVVLQTFVGDEHLTSPEEIDLFLVNSVELAKKRENFIPWIPIKFKKDGFIDKAIKDSISDEEFSDTIKDSGIVSLSADSNTSSLEVY